MSINILEIEVEMTQTLMNNRFNGDSAKSRLNVNGMMNFDESLKLRLNVNGDPVIEFNLVNDFKRCKGSNINE